ncbi:MAG: hypothetical protein JO036_13780 [Candidatus Eremiobacteraeota bacterium]|nr:hypothetical protein [Candidatus Eremiobacteraeota bacterium]
MPQHDLDARPAKLVFRPLFPVRAPLQVIAVVSKGPTGFTVPAPKELCAYGAAWNVLALDTKGKLMGFEGEAGHFTIDCTKKTPAPHITPAPPSGPSPNCVSTTGAHIYIRPCIGVPGDVIAVLPQVMLTYKPWKLNFTPLFAVLGPTKVIASVEEHPGGFVVHAPVELCRLGPPLPPGVTMPPTAEFNWNVTATDEALKPMGYLGEVGHYKIKCTAEQTKTPLATPSSGPPAGCGGTSTLVKIDPCAGPPGTKIKVWKSSTLATTPALLIFKIFAPKSAPEIRAPITGGGGSLSATASAELCKYGPKWHVSVLDSTGTGLGDVGTFTIVCLAGGRPPPPTPTATPTPTPTPTPKPKLTPKPPGNKAPVPTPTPPGCSPMIPNCMLVPGQPNAFIVPPGQRVPPALRFQSAAGQVQPIVAQVQNAGGRLSFTIPSTMCRGSLAQWLVYAADANGAAVGQIGVAYTNC